MCPEAIIMLYKHYLDLSNLSQDNKSTDKIKTNIFTWYIYIYIYICCKNDIS